jgi:predicted Zn-dependent peptidase
LSTYKNDGVIEVYAGVNTSQRDLAVESIVNEIKKLKKDGITEAEFERTKEQVKSSTLFARESTSSQMIIHGKYLSFLDEEFDYDTRIERLEKVSISDVHDAIERSFNIDDIATATVGPKRTPLKI